MSTASLLIAKKDGQLEKFAEYANSWGFNALVFDSLVSKYQSLIENTPIKESQNDIALGPFKLWCQLWNWSSGEDAVMRAWEANVLAMSYDRAYLQGTDDILRYAKSLEMFQNALALPNRVSHLAKMAYDLRLAVSGGAEYVAWYPMSVSENLWMIRDNESEDSDYHLLSFASEKDMETVKPCLYRMLPEDGEKATVSQCG